MLSKRIGYSAEELSDIQSIRDAAHRYCRGVDRLDAEEMRSAYWPDATDDHGVFVGNAMEFVDRVIASHARWRATMHCILNHHIELDGDGVGARGEIYNVTYLFHRDAEIVDTWWGRYLDRYEQRGGHWRIAERVCVHEGTRTSGVGEPMAIPAEMFRQGSVDRAVADRRRGP
jgi:hypothetical protein